MMLTDLATAARKSGLKVVEVSGWKTRGHGPMNSVRGILCHHTAGGNLKGDLRVVTYGRSDLPGPLSQIVLAPDGTVYIVAAGRCYHAGPTADPSTQSNSNSIGIEAVHRGVGAWTPAQYNAYVDLVAALCEHYDISTNRVKGHKEAGVPRGRKVDPNFSMPTFRGDVAKARAGGAVYTSQAADARTRGPFPLPAGHWFGPESKDPRNHSGYAVSDRQAVTQIQRVVGANDDGRYGPATQDAVKAWQRKKGLPATGTVDEVDWSRMGAHTLTTPTPSVSTAPAAMKATRAPAPAPAPAPKAATAPAGPRTRGPFPLPRGHWYGPKSSSPKNHSGYVKADRAGIHQLQRVVGTLPDGIYGPATKAAVARWQKAHGLTADGLVGAETWSKMGAGSTY